MVDAIHYFRLSLLASRRGKMARIKQYREVIALMEKYKITLECLCKYTVTIDGKRYYVPKMLRKSTEILEKYKIREKLKKLIEKEKK